MTDSEKLIIYKSCVKNVRSHEKAFKAINMVINNCMSKNDMEGEKIHTKIAALLFCSWAESFFKKLIHTPHGFTTSEIIRINKVTNVYGKWIKCLEIASAKIATDDNATKQHIKEYFESLCKEYIEKPSHLRNRIAHGQIEIALNSTNTAINIDLTNKLENLNIVTILQWKSVFELVSQGILYLIESWSKRGPEGYTQKVEEINTRMASVESWTIEKKRENIQRKKRFQATERYS
ncbi:hypothetical protein JMF94_13075 [Desulfovibrio sp. UIB00]|uniref:hypothetical protein n=1 Tax=Desulfovibrio sp. UIB00 TaxID=2804314 RepID=UPI001F105FBE|nr:hypothetical protein [Desulfovibrio sp. UIB00]MCH5146016.1 hypothetical protein [Desulfovibrio sp. UIB00]